MLRKSKEKDDNSHALKNIFSSIMACSFNNFKNVKCCWFEITKDAYVKFINDHLLEFSGKFSENLSQTNPNDFYGNLSTLLVQFIHDELDYYKLKN